MFKEPDSQPPQRDGGETYEPAPLRYMRSARSGPSDDGLSWVGGKKTRAELVDRGNKAGPSGMSNYDHNLSLLGPMCGDCLGKASNLPVSTS